MSAITTASAEKNPVGLDCLEEAFLEWKSHVEGALGSSIVCSEEDMGHMEERLVEESRELQRKVLEEAAQKKADAAPPNCPVCGNKLTRCSEGHERSFTTRFGAIRIKRLRGYCRRCKEWRTPADTVLGLEESAGYSPSVQEMAALMASKMPVAEASAVLERLTGVKLPPATLAREAQRQGKRAERERKRLDGLMGSAEGKEQQVKELRLGLPLQPFTMVIEIDAWNIRERDHWGKSQQMRENGEEPSRWHWVYGGTCFRLSQRVESAGGRPMILSRGTVMTLGGVDALREQLFAEAMRHGLGCAREVLVIADGALWIWNLANDRFGGARQRLDFYHASEHLWSVARALHPQDESAARSWVDPLLKQLRAGEGVPLISSLHALLENLTGSTREVLEREAHYFENNRHRLDYAEAKLRGEPLGSGAMESTCRQYQCRFKRPGQFWSREGDEALMCLETFWRNGRWHLLFPHSPPAPFSPFQFSKN